MWIKNFDSSVYIIIMVIIEIIVLVQVYNIGSDYGYEYFIVYLIRKLLFNYGYIYQLWCIDMDIWIGWY